MSKVKHTKKSVKVEPPKKTRDDEVTAAVQSLREFHRMGKTVSVGEYGDAVIDKAAAENEINPDTMRKARQFADPKRGYSNAELDQLCKTIQKVQINQEFKKPVFGRSHVIRILSVPKPRRVALQNKAIKREWSLSQLEDAIKLRFGTRRDGGRRRRVPHDPSEILEQLEGYCEMWRRWSQVASKTGSGETGEPFAIFAEPLKTRIIHTDASVWFLHQAVVDELKATNPNRKGRSIFVPPEKPKTGRKAANES